MYCFFFYEASFWSIYHNFDSSSLATSIGHTWRNDVCGYDIENLEVYIQYDIYSTIGRIYLCADEGSHLVNITQRNILQWCNLNLRTKQDKKASTSVRFSYIFMLIWAIDMYQPEIQHEILRQRWNILGDNGSTFET